MPEYAIAEDVGINIVDYLRSHYKDGKNNNGCYQHLQKGKTGVQYKINQVRAISFDLCGEWAKNTIIIYDTIAVIGDPQQSAIYGIHSKSLFNIDVKLKPHEPQMICLKLNELGFTTVWTQLGSCGSATNDMLSGMFSVIIN